MATPGSGRHFRQPHAVQRGGGRPCDRVGPGGRPATDPAVRGRQAVRDRRRQPVPGRDRTQPRRPYARPDARRRDGRAHRHAHAPPARPRACAARLRRRGRLQPRRTPTRGVRRGRAGDTVGRAHAALGRAGAQRTADHLPGARLLTRQRAARRRRDRPSQQTAHRVQGRKRPGLGPAPTRPDRRTLQFDVGFACLQPRRRAAGRGGPRAAHRDSQGAQRQARREAPHRRLGAIGGVLPRRRACSPPATSSTAGSSSGRRGPGNRSDAHWRVTRGGS